MLPPPKPDGTQGTGTVQLTRHISDDKVETRTKNGCFVKNDANLQDFIKDSIKPSTDRNKFEETKYFFYIPDDKELSADGNSKAKITYHRFSMFNKDKSRKLKNPQIVKVDEHLFLLCDSKEFNKCAFLKDNHTKNCRAYQSLDINQEVFGLCEDKGKVKFIPFKILNQCASNCNMFDIEKPDYDKLKDAGPLLQDDGKTLVGCYRKTGNGCTVSISIFGKHEGSTGTVILYTYIHTLLNAPKKAFQQQFTIKMMKINSYIEKN
jgi:hypothetical protein